jgi:hypothetical protein
MTRAAMGIALLKASPAGSPGPSASLRAAVRQRGDQSAPERTPQGDDQVDERVAGVEVVLGGWQPSVASRALVTHRYRQRSLLTGIPDTDRVHDLGSQFWPGPRMPGHPIPHPTAGRNRGRRQHPT